MLTLTSLLIAATASLVLLSPVRHGLGQGGQEDRPRGRQPAGRLLQPDQAVGVEAYGKEKGIEVITVDAKGDSATQVSQVQDLITQGIDALIYIPAGATAATVPTKTGQGAGIPVINVDRNRRRRARRHLHRRRTASPPPRPSATTSSSRPAARARWSSSTARRARRPKSTASKAASEALDEPIPASSWSASCGATGWSPGRGLQARRRTCCRRIPDVSIIFGQADALALGAAQAVEVANPGRQGLVLAASTATSRRSKAAEGNGVFDVTATQQTQKHGPACRRFGDQDRGRRQGRAEQLRTPNADYDRENVAAVRREPSLKRRRNDAGGRAMTDELPSWSLRQGIARAYGPIQGAATVRASTSGRARSWRCSARTAPASRPCPTSSPAPFSRQRHNDLAGGALRPRQSERRHRRRHRHDPPGAEAAARPRRSPRMSMSAAARRSGGRIDRKAMSQRAAQAAAAARA